MIRVRHRICTPSKKAVHGQAPNYQSHPASGIPPCPPSQTQNAPAVLVLEERQHLLRGGVLALFAGRDLCGESRLDLVPVVALVGFVEIKPNRPPPPQ